VNKELLGTYQTAPNLVCKSEESLPPEIKCMIFQNLREALPQVALVCQKWKAIVDHKDFRKLIHPGIAFGSREWKQYMGADAGEEPYLPRCAYGEMEKGKYLLTFIPNTIQVVIATRAYKVPLNSLEVLGKLIDISIKGITIGYDVSCSKAILREKRKQDKPHWVLIDKENKEIISKAPRVNSSKVMDIVISLLMDNIRFGRGKSTVNAAKNEYKWKYVQERALARPLLLGFSDSSLIITKTRMGF
jgi:hypothetical protein